MNQLTPDSRIFVAGHNGLVGSSLVRELRTQGFDNLILRSRAELDLSSEPAVADFFASERPSHVFLAAAKVGGIHANDTCPVDFLETNLRIQNCVIHNAWKHGVQKLLFFGSCCIYPRLAPQPLREEYLLTGPLEPTNEWYAIAKIAGIKLCQAYRRQHGFNAISIMPTNLYGPGDNFDLAGSHVLPALIRKFHESKVSQCPEVVVWGTGAPRREFMHADDLARAAVFLMQNYDSADIINVGVDGDISIADLAHLVARIVGFEGAIRYDSSKPDGVPLRRVDVSRLRGLGWTARIGLESGIVETYDWYLKNHARGVIE